MKQFYNSKSLLRLSFLFVLLFSVITVVNSCKKDEFESEYICDYTPPDYISLYFIFIC